MMMILGCCWWRMMTLQRMALRHESTSTYGDRATSNIQCSCESMRARSAAFCRQLEAGQLSCCPNARWMLGAVSRCLGCSVHGTRVFEAFSCACFIYWHQSIANLNCLEYLRASLFLLVHHGRSIFSLLGVLRLERLEEALQHGGTSGWPVGSDSTMSLCLFCSTSWCLLSLQGVTCLVTTWDSSTPRHHQNAQNASLRLMGPTLDTVVLCNDAVCLMDPAKVSTLEYLGMTLGAEFLDTWQKSSVSRIRNVR